MSRFQKSFSLAVILALLFSSLIIVESAYALASKPSVPEFSLKYVEHPYDVAPTYTTDPYSGKSVIDHQGRHVENKSIEVTIKNQAFTSVKDASGNYTSLYYIFRYKGHFSNTWTNEPTFFDDDAYYNASKSEYTVISFQFNGVSAGDQIDFQVQALIGHDAMRVVDVPLRPFWGYAYYFSGEAGDWSGTQTITIPAGASTETPNPTFLSPTPTNSQNPTISPSQPSQNNVFFGFGWEQIAIIVLAVAVAILLVALAVLAHKVNVMQTQIRHN
jgi:hypothetical protein